MQLLVLINTVVIECDLIKPVYFQPFGVGVQLPKGKTTEGVNQNNFYSNSISISEPLEEAGGHLVTFTAATN